MILMFLLCGVDIDDFDDSLAHFVVKMQMLIITLTITTTISGWSSNDRGGGGSWLTNHSSWMSRGQDQDKENHVKEMMMMITMINTMISMIIT